MYLKYNGKQMKNIYKISLLSIFLATTTVNANYYINVDVEKKEWSITFFD